MSQSNRATFIAMKLFFFFGGGIVFSNLNGGNFAVIQEQSVNLKEKWLAALDLLPVFLIDSLEPGNHE